ncbi:MAG: TRAP transporter substrate-binding protein [Pelomonas sp.]|nr:TRAP transporter substrate-binding protein [Roseateles sp.]
MSDAVNRRQLVAGLAAGLGLPGLRGARADAPIVIKFSHVVAPDTPKGKGALRFKALVEARTHGRVRVEVYPDSQLYQDKEEVEALQLGSVQMLAPSLSKFAPLGVREFEVFDLPFLFKDQAAYRALTEGRLGRELLDRLETTGVKGLAYWDNGFTMMSANRPLRHVADFRGLKMRIQSSKVLDAQMRALGAVPQVLAFGELYQALQTGVVDGTETTPSNIYTQRLYEVQKFITASNHGHLGYAVIVNKKFWEGLPTELRLVLEAALKESTGYANALAASDNAAAFERIKASRRVGLIELAPAEVNEWKRALMPVHREMEERVGRATIDAAYQAAGFIKPV